MIKIMSKIIDKTEQAWYLMFLTPIVAISTKLQHDTLNLHARVPHDSNLHARE